MSDDIDLDNLATLKTLMEEKFNELIDTYVEDSEMRIDMIREALETWDLDTVKHQAHGLKGSSRNLGANPLAELCEVMEKQAREEALEGGQQQLTAIEQKFAAVREKLLELRDA